MLSEGSWKRHRCGRKNRNFILYHHNLSLSGVLGVRAGESAPQRERDVQRHQGKFRFFQSEAVSLQSVCASKPASTSSSHGGKVISHALQVVSGACWEINCQIHIRRIGSNSSWSSYRRILRGRLSQGCFQEKSILCPEALLQSGNPTLVWSNFSTVNSHFLEGRLLFTKKNSHFLEGLLLFFFGKAERKFNEVMKRD